jgi:hypothetical protein
VTKAGKTDPILNALQVTLKMLLVFSSKTVTIIYRHTGHQHPQANNQTIKKSWNEQHAKVAYVIFVFF